MATGNHNLVCCGILHVSLQLGVDRREVIRWNSCNGQLFQAPLMGLILMLRTQTSKVSDGLFSKNQHVSVLSNTPINIKEISGCSINSRAWISTWNFASKLIAELVPFRLLECLVEMGAKSLLSLRHI